MDLVAVGGGRRPSIPDPAGRGRPVGAKVSSPHGSHPGRESADPADGVTLDIPLAIGGLLVGTIVGLTGMGGGALMTPMLIFFFGVDPLTAVSSDIVVSLFMKPVGAFVHLRHGTVNLKLVAWLCVGSVPLAFAGAWLISQIPPDVSVDAFLKRALGVALLITTVAWSCGRRCRCGATGCRSARDRRPRRGRTSSSARSRP